MTPAFSLTQFPKMADLRAAWHSLVMRYAAAPDASKAVFDDLIGRYSEQERFYHNLYHLAEVLEAIEKLRGLPKHLSAVLLAAWFHDAIYDSRAKDNEERSAGHARQALNALSVPAEIVEEVERLILLTKHHLTVEQDIDGQVLADADLSILGATAARYREYAAAVRREYAWVAEDAYRLGRRQVLTTFLERPRIYTTPPMFAALENRARSNLVAEARLLHG